MLKGLDSGLVRLAIAASLFGMSCGPSRGQVGTSEAPSSVPGLVQIDEQRESGLLVVGTVFLENMTVAWLPTQMVTPRHHSPDPGGAYELVATDWAGKEFLRQSFDAAELSDAGPPSEQFDVVLHPYTPGSIQQLQLFRNGIEIGTIKASHQRTIEVRVSIDAQARLPIERTRLSWQATASPNTELSYAIYYSIDDGDTWRALAVQVFDTQFVVDRPLRVADGTARLFVSASDGLNASYEISEAFYLVE